MASRFFVAGLCALLLQTAYSPHASSQAPTSPAPLRTLIYKRIPVLSAVSYLTDDLGCDEAKIREVLTSTISPTSWKDARGPGEIRFASTDNAFVVIQTPEVQAQVADMVASLKRLHAEEKKANDDVSEEVAGLIKACRKAVVAGDVERAAQLAVIAFELDPQRVKADRVAALFARRGSHTVIEDTQTRAEHPACPQVAKVECTTKGSISPNAILPTLSTAGVDVSTPGFTRAAEVAPPPLVAAPHEKPLDAMGEADIMAKFAPTAVPHVWLIGDWTPDNRLAPKAFRYVFPIPNVPVNVEPEPTQPNAEKDAQLSPFMSGYIR